MGFAEPDMALDRQSIEKKDFPVGRRGYEPEAVDAHLSAIAGEVAEEVRILGDEPGIKRAKRALQSLSDQTGGVAFFPKDLMEVDEISQEVARDIRNQYTLTYKPTNPRSNGGYRKVKVEARAPGYKDLQVRTRDGYFADEKRTVRRLIVEFEEFSVRRS